MASKIQINSPKRKLKKKKKIQEKKGWQSKWTVKIVKRYLDLHIIRLTGVRTTNNSWQRTKTWMRQTITEIIKPYRQQIKTKEEARAWTFLEVHTQEVHRSPSASAAPAGKQPADTNKRQRKVAMKKIVWRTKWATSTWTRSWIRCCSTTTIPSMPRKNKAWIFKATIIHNQYTLGTWRQCIRKEIHRVIIM